MAHSTMTTAYENSSIILRQRHRLINMIDALVAAVSDVVCASAYPLKPQKADRLLTAKVIQCAYV